MWRPLMLFQWWYKSYINGKKYWHCEYTSVGFLPKQTETQIYALYVLAQESHKHHDVFQCVDSTLSQFISMKSTAHRHKYTRTIHR